MTACLLILAPAGGVLALGLLAAGAAVPPLAVAVSRRAARETALARGDLSAMVTDLLSGAADLHAFGAQDAALAAAAAADGQLTALARRSAIAAGLGSGLIVAVSGLTLWGVLVLGVAAVADGTLTRGAAGRGDPHRPGRLRGGHRLARSRPSARRSARLGRPHWRGPRRAGPGCRTGSALPAAS